jgi:hypothetical protein
MGDSLFNIVILLIPVAIFIGRIVLQAQAKRRPETPRKQPPIPVHFEDYDDEDERQFAPSAVPKQVINKAINNKDRADTYSPPTSIDSASKPPPSRKTKTPSAEPVQGFLDLNHLSPMKQAVVMAEILGPPKGMQ